MTHTLTGFGSQDSDARIKPSYMPPSLYNHYLGKTYLKGERYEEAGKYLRSAWGSNPNIPELKYDFAFLNYKTADYSRAADLFAEISEEAPSNLLAQYYAGISLYKQER